MERSRIKSFSVVLSCFASTQRYEEINCIEEEEEEEEESTKDFEKGVPITVQRLAGGSYHVKHIKFSRQVFSEMQARLWWEENGLRVHEHYASASPSTSEN
ncbi:hypothetical protein SUGI_0179730 [Cryptomeria japonica]|nr:hypothetical protein SUGI_0179730 [Cryptomeria japonica]